MSAHAAEKCFVENRNLFADVNGNNEQQEKWNLYNGLANLAAAVAAIESDIARIKQNLR